MPCTNCADVELSNCNGLLLIESGLPEGAYTVRIDRQLSRFSAIVTADAEGIISVDLTLFPAGLLNPYGGAYFIEIEDHSIIAYPQVDCIRAEVINGDWTQNVISPQTITL